MIKKQSVKGSLFSNDCQNVASQESVGQASAPADSPVGQASLLASYEEKLQIYRRKLPHWRLSGAVYFVTWRLHGSQPEITPDERTVVLGAIRHFSEYRYQLFAYVVMNDHVHVLVKPRDEHPLYTLLHSWKSFTAHQFQRQFGRRGPIWQDEYFDRIVRDEDEFLEKAQYILNNPRKRWPELEEYPWVGFCGPDE